MSTGAGFVFVPAVAKLAQGCGAKPDTQRALVYAAATIGICAGDPLGSTAAAALQFRRIDREDARRKDEADDKRSR